MSAYVDAAGDSYSLKHPSRPARAARSLGAIALVLAALIGLGFSVAPASATLFGTRAPSEDARGESAGAETYVDGAGDATSREATRADLLSGRWDGRTVHLDWRGAEYDTAQASFVGERVISPGDHIFRTLGVRNDGPSDAVMSVGLVLAETVPVLAANPELGDEVTLFWDVAGVRGSAPFSDLIALDDGRPELVQVQVPRGAEVPVTVGFDVPAALTTEMNGRDESSALRFDVRVQIEGDTSTIPPTLAATGGTAALAALLLALALGILAAGLLLLAARRRRCDGCGGSIRGGAPWVARRAASGLRQSLCLGCAPAPVLLPLALRV